MNQFLLSILFAVLFIASCSEEPSLPVKTTASIYVDLLVAEEKYPNNPDSLLHYRQKVFEKYNITKKEYEKSLSQLEYDNDKWDEFFELSEAYLDTLKNSSTK